MNPKHLPEMSSSRMEGRALGLVLAPDDLPLTVCEAAVYLGVSIQTMNLWVERKQIFHLRLMGRNLVLRWGLESLRAAFKRVYKELAPMKKEAVNLANAIVWIPDSKAACGVAIPLTEFAVEAFRDQLATSGPGAYVFPNPGNQASFKKVWSTHASDWRDPLLPNLRSTVNVRDSPQCGGVADEWVTHVSPAETPEGVES
jgi:excisionase family DNA binding protein